MYGPRPKFAISYPDLIQEDGQFWITETQKAIARIHPIDRSLLEGMWNQGKDKKISTDALVLSLQGNEAACGQTSDMPHLPPFNPFDGEVGSFSIDFEINFGTLSPGQISLDARNEIGRGVVITTVDGAGVRIELNDEQAIAAWDCRAEQITPGAW